jgi:hypothetical protein
MALRMENLLRNETQILRWKARNQKAPPPAQRNELPRKPLKHSATQPRPKPFAAERQPRRCRG